MAWPSFCRRMAQGARKLGDSEGMVVRYLRVRERQTRQLAVKLWSEEDWPWGEAMTRVWTQDLAVMWTVTMQSNAFGLQVSIPGLTDHGDDIHEPSRKRNRQANSWSNSGASSSADIPRGGGNPRRDQMQNQNGDLPSSQLQRWMRCSAWNSNKGCSHKGKDCPHQKLHRCSFNGPDGICGAKGHGASTCPRRNQSNDNKQ